MPDFVRLDEHLPGTCLTCGDYAPPMWYLRELDSGQPALMCRSCIEQLGRQIGMVSDDQADQLRARARELERKAEEAEDQVGIEKKKQIQVVSMNDVMAMIGAHTDPDPTEPAGAVAQPPKYTVRRKNKDS